MAADHKRYTLQDATLETADSMNDQTGMPHAFMQPAKFAKLLQMLLQEDFLLLLHFDMQVVTGQ